MRGAVSNKDDQLKDNMDRIAILERELESMTQSRRAARESEELLKEDNWNLHIANDQAQNLLSENTMTIQKLNSENTKLAGLQAVYMAEIEALQLTHANLQTEHEAYKTKQETKMRAVQKEQSNLENDLVALQSRYDSVSKELEERKTKAPLYRNLSPVKQPRVIINEDSDDEFDTLDNSPTQSPTKGGHSRNAPLEAETLKSALFHSHKVAANLKTNLRKEREEKAELKKRVEELERAQKTAAKKKSLGEKCEKNIGERRRNGPSGSRPISSGVEEIYWQTDSENEQEQGESELLKPVCLEVDVLQKVMVPQATVPQATVPQATVPQGAPLSDKSVVFEETEELTVHASESQQLQETIPLPLEKESETGNDASKVKEEIGLLKDKVSTLLKHRDLLEKQIGQLENTLANSESLIVNLKNINSVNMRSIEKHHKEMCINTKDKENLNGIISSLRAELDNCREIIESLRARVYEFENQDASTVTDVQSLRTLSISSPTKSINLETLASASPTRSPTRIQQSVAPLSSAKSLKRSESLKSVPVMGPPASTAPRIIPNPSPVRATQSQGALSTVASPTKSFTFKTFRAESPAAKSRRTDESCEISPKVSKDPMLTDSKVLQYYVNQSYSQVIKGLDPEMTKSITQLMIGEYMWKYVRKAGFRQLSDSRHRRYLWVHPFTRTVHWSAAPPQSGLPSSNKSKSMLVKTIKVVSDTNSSPPGLSQESILLFGTNRVLKVTALTSYRHLSWVRGLEYLLKRVDSKRDL